MSRLWKILIALAAVLVVLPCAWVATLGTAPEKAVEAYKKSLIARGEKLDIADVSPPPVATGQNGLDAFNEGVSAIPPGGNDWRTVAGGMRMVAPGKAMVVFMQPEVREIDFTNSWSNLIAVQDDNRAATELFEQAAAFPALDFHVDYTQGPEKLLRYLPDLKRAAQRLSTDAICNLHKGDAGSAATNICAVVGLTKAEQDDRFVISQLVRIALAAIAANATWEFLQSGNVNDEELAMLQKSWEQLQYIQPMENSFLMERASDEATIKKMRDSEEYFNRMMNEYAPRGSGGGSGGWPDSIQNFLDNVRFGYAKSMWKATWTYSDELRMLQQDQIILESVRAIETNDCFNSPYADMEKRLKSIGTTNEPEFSFPMDAMDLRWMFSGNGPVLASTIRRVMAAEVTRNVIITAIALKRCQLKYGSYPDALSKLVPQFLAAVPNDPVDGKPLRYRLNGDGTFLLYSIGPNGKDDGGNPSLDVSTGTGSYSVSFYWLNPHALDWVWPQPATPAEIQYFYDHPPK